jgi:hypothetical protein
MLGCTSWVGRCFAISIMIAVCGRGSLAAAATCNIISAHHPSDAEDPSSTVTMIGLLFSTRRSCNKNPAIPR